MSSIARTIEIIKIPHGDAPGWVRAAWVGCQFPTATLECGHVPVYVESVLPRTRTGLMSVKEFLALPKEIKIAGYKVNQAVALNMLKSRDGLAYRWWISRGFPNTHPDHNCFRFKHEEVKVLETYTDAELMKLGPLTRCDDMETGTMRPMC